MIVTTKHGDQGNTVLFGAKRVSKHHFKIEIIGQLDQLQVVIGLLKTKVSKTRILAELLAIQKTLYRTMAAIANTKALISQELATETKQLEVWQAFWIKKSSIKNQFVIPGQNEAEAFAHLARTQTRQVERLLSKHKQIELIPYFNRLSDYFFVISQYLLKP
ncbi:hypothetical protein A2313_01385 [Candidatus Roizmanbacteria bacterium RIFOXYB2_FULL_41_10]|uniref:Corrinoid adenosyltransferase n=1 Tax=Candidatus Roizmanbacteria bacterium RIFOXYA1_FULL_41_12 TaxID=1802082 RepID=A0A1F7K944_9BACT|nr:MAG: hypothetical protein A2209_02605 [Candidatus Roizmanbacteria bacterium RIFOXYA1_FULL_41_12]OGK66364.1 MAG: hypothetical protein A2262_02730 [Candidatus Roizmanbacteria bacterium RIFOXYA2_FULL_41_8]OGK71029.1 MAG: hypothetical protein A2313_01385 [Candidatus Roizmanbacteria bacterium RIFOXYB2_FULL_41_10]OGK71332.1 MAG: hypothetical protein A2403_00925 [Candidatus Roizmanbacteria bacterium RIFOXYC1_FULL_41_16]OGK74402.1 MAG: hypothetical protein A2459_03475 [Candidatus Roizmanbacteria bac